ncbi:hypothetical protein GL213_06640 [Halogeometricum borinquense]|uniref:Restriction endonuclease n=2 Tax=Halogeometricum borinquense (strain ATCC 700274 / DSM 11551 / JCM 10706 / KCTC 4070 / PR3) TaxID=469382 RepID=L9V005_HALBP|nr:hypothetical protein [Halogeometricum borinquense]ELY30419.1 hypothetical protein C499_04098 [Halogeometricum borinquense DSM 11551]QIQ76223.1 hypothetical protein GL213_06640 [Halogeometricum borinquense]
MSSDLDFTVYAIKLQPAGETGFFEGCRDAEVIGTGWDPQRSCASPGEIEQAHKQVGKDPDHNRTINSGALRHELRYIVKEMSDGSGDAPHDYVWVNEGSEFALCKVTSECTTSHDVSEPLREELTNENGTQIHNIRHVDWTDIPVEFVPGYVKRKFTGRFGTLNRMKKGVDDDARRVIQELHSVDDFDGERTLDFERLETKLESMGSGKLFSILDADDTEEVVLDYLQSNGWRITKYSTGDSQAKYECELRRVTNGGREAGFVQVKSGDASLTPAEYSDLTDEGRVFLFSSPSDDGGQQLSVDQEGLTVINPEKLADHLRENARWLPTPTLLRLSFSS